MKQEQSIRAIKRYRTLKMARLIGRAYCLNRKKRQADLYDFLGNELMELGGVYIKFLQGLMLQSPKLMNHWKNPAKLNIFEKLESETIDVNDYLERELGPDKDRLTGLGPEPFAAGSFGQVYQATLDGQTNVIIKILRPQIHEMLRFDLKLLRWFWQALSRRLISPISSQHLDINGNFRSFASQTLTETDYVAEANFAYEQYLAYQDHPKLVIPKTHIELCRPTIIVQDYVGGLSAATLVELNLQGVNPVRYVRDKVGSNIYEQFQTLAFELTWGTFHLPRIMGDAHPGNIKLLKDDKIALIDFGISATPPDNLAAFFNLIIEYGHLSNGRFNPGRVFSSYLRYFGRDLYRALMKIGKISNPPINLNQKLAAIAEANLKHLIGSNEIEKILQSPQALGILDRIANQDNQLALKTRLDDDQIIRAGLAFNSLLANLGVYHKVMQPTYKKVIAAVNRQYPELKNQADPEMSAAEAIDVVSNWLERLANRNPALFRNLIQQMPFHGPRSINLNQPKVNGL